SLHLRRLILHVLATGYLVPVRHTLYQIASVPILCLMASWFPVLLNTPITGGHRCTATALVMVTVILPVITMANVIIWLVRANVDRSGFRRAAVSNVNQRLHVRPVRLVRTPGLHLEILAVLVAVKLYKQATQNAQAHRLRVVFVRPLLILQALNV